MDGLRVSFFLYNCIFCMEDKLGKNGIEIWDGAKLISIERKFFFALLILSFRVDWAAGPCKMSFGCVFVCCCLSRVYVCDSRWEVPDRESRNSVPFVFRD